MEDISCYFGESEVHFRYKVISPLLQSAFSQGELKSKIDEISQEEHFHPGKKEHITVSKSTIERWYYRAKNADNPFEALRPTRRKDKGKFRSLDQRMAKILLVLIEEYPHWSRKLMWQNWKVSMEKEGIEEPYPSYSSALRFFKEIGFEPTPTFRNKNEKNSFLSQKMKEKRSFREPLVGGLYHLDFHSASFQIADKKGMLRTPKGLAIRDNHSGFICYFAWYFGETCEVLVHALTHAFLKYDLPRRIMADNGSAMIAQEYFEGLKALGIEPARIPPYSPWKNGKIERYWQIVEKRLLAMLNQVQGMSLHQLNVITQAWLNEEYHLTTPLGRKRNVQDIFLLSESNLLKKCPSPEELRRAFMRVLKRKVKKEDGTISLEGVRFEIPGDFNHLKEVLVKYSSWDLSLVLLTDEDRNILARLRPLNLETNSSAKRRFYSKPPQKKIEDLDLPPLLEKTVDNFFKNNQFPGFWGYEENDE